VPRSTVRRVDCLHRTHVKNQLKRPILSAAHAPNQSQTQCRSSPCMFAPCSGWSCCLGSLKAAAQAPLFIHDFIQHSRRLDICETKPCFWRALHVSLVHHGSIPPLRADRLATASPRQQVGAFLVYLYVVKPLLQQMQVCFATSNDPQ
jgi:hypothetical protein